MQSAIHTMRRRTTAGILRGSLRATQGLPQPGIRLLGAAVGQMARWGLRRRLLANLQAALGPVEPHIADCWFQRLSRWCADSCRIYHRGLAQSGILDQITLGSSVTHLDEAVKRGRGVVLAAPHLFRHEIGAGVINLRHRVTAIVRESRDPRHAALKAHWYRRLGLQTVTIRRDTNPVAECRRLLRDGAVLGITPDCVALSEDGHAVRMFNRAVRLKAGAFALSLYSGAPLVTCLGRWAPSGDHLDLQFTSPTEVRRHRRLSGTSDAGARLAATEVLRDALQSWVSDFESFLRQQPQDWLFWLDKRWTEVLRAPGREGDRTA